MHLNMNNKNKNSHRGLLAVVLATALCAVSAAQAEVVWVPNAGINFKSLSFDRPFTTGTTDATFIMLDASLTAAFDDFFITLNTNQPMSDESSSDPNGEATIDRSDSTLTIGCNCLAVVEKLTMFVGYTIGNTDIDALAPSAVGGKLVENYEDKGFFLGGSYPLWVTRQGSLTGTMAYAFLDGSVQITAPGASINEAPTGTTEGTSIGLSWNGGLTQDTNYSVSLKRQAYVFEEDGGLFSLNQTYNNLSATVTFFF